MKIAKPFLRDGVVLQPGDPLPDGIDKQTLAHYERHGMVREDDDDEDARKAVPVKPAPQQRQSRAPRRPGPSNAPTVAPQNATSAAPADALVPAPANASTPVPGETTGSAAPALPADAAAGPGIDDAGKPNDANQANP